MLFPNNDLSKASQPINLSVTSPVLYGTDSLQRFFEASIDKTIYICIDSRRIDDARLLCVWRNRNPKNILLLESVQKSIAVDLLSHEDNKLLFAYGFTEDLEPLLDTIAAKKGWMFVLISLHFKAARRLNWTTTDLLRRKKTDFVESGLSVTLNHLPLLRDLNTIRKLTEQDALDCLGHSFAHLFCSHIFHQISWASLVIHRSSLCSNNSAQILLLSAMPCITCKGDAMISANFNHRQPSPPLLNLYKRHRWMRWDARSHA